MNLVQRLALGLTAFSALCPAYGASPGMHTKELRRSGWFGYGPPKFSLQPVDYPASAVAASTPGCTNSAGIVDNYSAEVAESDQQQCEKQGYTGIHLYISIAHHDISDRMAAAAAAADPWSKSKALRSRVFLVQTEDRDELRAAVAKHLVSCHVITYAYVSSHGSSGYINWGPHGKLGKEPLGYFLMHALHPCAFAPGAHIQFDACNIGCGTGAEAVRQSLENVFELSDGYGNFDSRTTHFFEGLEVYVNTDTAENSVPGSFERFFGAKPHAYADNGLGVVFTDKNGSFDSDIPADKVPACTDDKSFPLNDWEYDTVRFAR